MDVHGLHLVNHNGRDEDEVEDRHQTHLKVERAVPDHPESEPGEKSAVNVQEHLIPDVVRTPPRGDQLPFRDHVDLEHLWGGEARGKTTFLSLMTSFLRHLQLVLVQTVDLGHHVLPLLRLLPMCRPVDAFTSALVLHDFDHVLGGVGVLGARRAIPCEVVQEFGRGFSGLAEVHCPSPTSQKKKEIECVEHARRGLVDRANDGLSRFGEFPHEPYDVVC